MLEPTTGNSAPRIAYVTALAYPARVVAVDLTSGVQTTVVWDARIHEGSIAITPDGSRLYVPGGSAFGVLEVDLVSGSSSALPNLALLGAMAVALSPDGRTLYVQSNGYGVLSLDLGDPNAQPQFRGDIFGYYVGGAALAISPNGTSYAVSEDGSGLTVSGSALGQAWCERPTGLCFLDDDTLLVASSSGAMLALDLPSGVLSRVDAGISKGVDVEVAADKVFVFENDSAYSWSRLQQNALEDRIVSVDLRTASVATVSADGLHQGEVGLQASRDGTRLYFRRAQGDDRQLIELVLATGVARVIVSSYFWRFYVDEAAGIAFVLSPGVVWSELRLVGFELATGARTVEFTLPGELQDLRSFVVDSAAGRAIGETWLRNGPNPGLAVLGLTPGGSSLLDHVSVGGLYTSEPSADGRAMYSMCWVAGQLQLVLTEMLTLGHPQTVILSPSGLPFAFRVLNTADGANVVATPTDPVTGTSPVTLTFDSVTAAGDTTVTTSTTGPAIPSGFQLGGAGVYYEVTTTADFAGNVEICIDYTGTTFADESTLQLLHYEHGQWVNVTTTRDPATDRICGVVRSFSPFVVVEWPAMSALNDLLNRVHNLDIRHGIVVSLDAKLTAVQDALWHSLQGNRSSAANCLRAFIQEVLVQRERSLPASVADGLIADAEVIIALLGG
ncbi:MAG: PD40 domain-containing protein [Planctomycetes bacterium]|nr:PD40 domain-containing protein [Planctomycetota bacterium]